MKIKLVLTLLFFCFFLNRVNSQLPYEDLYNWNHDTSAIGYAFFCAPESSDYFVLGYLLSYDPTLNDITMFGWEKYGHFLLKFDRYGNQLWKKYYKTMTNTYDYKTAPDPQNIYFFKNDIFIPYNITINNITSDTINPGTFSAVRHALLKISSEDGQIIDNQYFGDTVLAKDFFLQYTEFSNDTLKIIYSEDNTTNYNIERRDFEFNLLDIHKKTIPNLCSQLTYDVVTKSYFGVSLHYSCYGQVCIVKFDDSLNFVWNSVSLTDTVNNFLKYDIKPTPYGDYIGFVQILNIYTAEYFSYLFRFDNQGNITNKKYFFKKILGLDFTSGNQIICLMEEQYSYNLDKPISINILDEYFNIIGRKEYGYQYVTDCNLKILPNDMYVVTGTRRTHINFGNLLASSVYVMCDSLSSITLDIQQIDKNSEFSIFPNPATNQIAISSSNNQIIKQIEIFDVNGRVLKTKRKCESQQITIEIFDLQSGFYFVKITESSGISKTMKFSKF